MQYQLNQICADGANHVAYVQVTDDLGNDLGEVCVAYGGNENEFKEAITKKVAKLSTRHNEKSTINNTINNILKSMK